MEKALTRDEFRNGVFKRDNHKCVVCGEQVVDAHHLIERRLFGANGGYFLSNGVSVCEKHHLECEMTLISCEELREKCGITEVILPDHFYDEYRYTKWGDIILNESRRVKGELFYDESVQKILKQGGVLDKYIKYIKYPRTMHLPWSQSVNKDDRLLDSVEHFKGKEVVVTSIVSRKPHPFRVWDELKRN
jgi:ribosomal protein S27AE